MTTNNHPAHGPVSLKRLRQISEILSKAAAQSDGGNLGYAMADAVKVIDGAIAEFEEQDNPRPVMAVKGELGFIDNLEKIIEERDEDIDIGQLGRSNYDALMLAALDAFRASLPTPVVPEPKSYMDFWEQYPDMTAQEAIDRSAGWNACRSAMLQGSQPVSNRDELPLDYLQGHKDGLEWAAQLAEANHPQTGDWLYDDQTELAKAIRKGPDMPPVESGNSQVIPDSSEDTKRLNWLDAQNKRLNEYYGTSYGWKFDANFQRNAMMLNDSNYPVMTVRQAIDQAIASAPQQEVKP